MVVPEIRSGPSCGYRKAANGNSRAMLPCTFEKQLAARPSLQSCVTFSLISHGGKVNVFII